MGKIKLNFAVSANIQLSVALFSRAYIAMHFIQNIPARCSYTQSLRSPRWISMKTHGVNRRLYTRRFKRRSRADRTTQAGPVPSACRLRSLLIRHSFLMTANKFSRAIFLAVIDSHLPAIRPEGFSRPRLTTKAAARLFDFRARMVLDLGEPPEEGSSIRGHSWKGLAKGIAVEWSKTSMILLFVMFHPNLRCKELYLQLLIKKQSVFIKILKFNLSLILNIHLAEKKITRED